MKKVIITFFMGMFLISSLYAEDERSRMQEEILNSLAEAEQARAKAIQTMQETVVQIEADRAQREEENLSSDSI